MICTRWGVWRTVKHQRIRLIDAIRKENIMSTFSASHPIPADMESKIDGYTAGLGAVGVPSGMIGPGTDLIVIAPTWVAMTASLAEEAGYVFEQHSLEKTVMAAATGIGAFGAGAKLATWLLSWVATPFTGGTALVVSGIANATLNATLTRAYGHACARYFLQADNFKGSEVCSALLVGLTGLGLGYDVSQQTYAEIAKNGHTIAT